MWPLTIPKTFYCFLFNLPYSFTFYSCLMVDWMYRQSLNELILKNVFDWISDSSEKCSTIKQNQVNQREWKLGNMTNENEVGVCSINYEFCHKQLKYIHFKESQLSNLCNHITYSVLLVGIIKMVNQNIFKPNAKLFVTLFLLT